MSRLAQSIREQIVGLDQIIEARYGDRAEAVEQNMDTLEALRDNLQGKLDALKRGEPII